jgi:hypothetical protein
MGTLIFLLTSLHISQQWERDPLVFYSVKDKPIEQAEKQ